MYMQIYINEQKKVFNYVEMTEDDKKYFNNKLLEIKPNLENDLETSKEPLLYALKIALAGNIIDFATVDNRFNLKKFSPIFMREIK